MTWSRAAAIGDPWVYLIVASEGAAGWRRGSSSVFRNCRTHSRRISLSLSLNLSQPIRGVAVASQGRHWLEGGWEDVDKMTLSK